MNKIIISTSLIMLLTCNANAVFDFNNYVPTLSGLYATDSNIYIPSGYVLYVLNYQPNDSWTTVSYSTYTNNVLNDSTYSYRVALNPDRTQNLDITEHLSLNNDSALGYFINGSGVSNSWSNVVIIGDFINNTTNDYVYDNGYRRTNSITGDFIQNNGKFIIFNNSPNSLYVGEIIDVVGNFIGNTANRVVSNAGTITNITGSFIKNNNTIDTNLYIQYSNLNYIAGTVVNIGPDANIANIVGDFIDNRANGNNSAGAIYNKSTIDNIQSDFINNFGYYGAIYNTGTIDNIKGNFINNSGQYGVIYSTGTINEIEGNFINNVSNGTTPIVVYNDVKFISSLSNYTISDNHLFNNNGRSDFVIRGNGNISFENNNATHYVINDEIHGVNLVIGGDNTGYTIFNNNIDNVNIVNINNGKMKLGRTPSDYTGTADIGRFNITNPTVNLTNGTFDIANGYTETITLNNLVSTGNNNIIKIDLDINNTISDIIVSENTIQGQINLVVNALSNLDLQDNIVWFAYANNDSSSIASADTFVLSNIDNLSYDLDIVFDVIETKWGLQKDPNSTYVPDEPENPENPDNPDNPDTPDEPDNPDNPENPDEPENPDTPDEPENPNNPDEPENPDNPDAPDEPDVPIEPEQPVQPAVPVLPVEVVQMADYTAKTVTNTVQKLTNSMQKRVGELQWLLKDNDNQSDLNNAFWTRGIHKNFDADNTSVGLSGIEFGYDRIISSTNNYKWYIGGLGYISGGDSKFKDTKLDISGYGLGAYLMVLEKSGWFVDAVFRQHFINMETSAVKTDYTASSLNLEIGKEFVFGSDKLKWFMKPSLEGTYISISGTDIGSFKVQDSTSSMASLSVLAGPRWDSASGRKFQAYGKVGYTLDNSDDVDVVVNGVNTKQTVATNTTEMGIGFDYRGIDNATNIYLEASYITGTDYSEISGNLGLRYAF